MSRNAKAKQATLIAMPRRSITSAPRAQVEEGRGPGVGAPAGAPWPRSLVQEAPHPLQAAWLDRDVESEQAKSDQLVEGAAPRDLAEVDDASTPEEVGLFASVAPHGR